MKNLIFLLLCIALVVSKTNAQVLLDNKTGCSLDVWVVCYDDPAGPCADDQGNPTTCCIVSETKYTVPANDNMTVSDCPYWTTLKVCFTSGSSATVTVAGNSPPTGCWAGIPQSAVLTGPCTLTVDNTNPGVLDMQ